MDFWDVLKTILVPILGYVIWSIRKEIAANTEITVAAKEVAEQKAATIELSLNGRLTQLLKEAKDAAYARGVAENLGRSHSAAIEKLAADVETLKRELEHLKPPQPPQPQ